MAKRDDVYAYAGKILRVNLSNGDITTEPTLNYAEEWLGSSGIAVKILYDRIGSWVTPYEPANKIIFGAGALQGTTAPGACKMTASTLGPVTGGWATSASDSYVGGQLKFAGYDLVVIEGKAHIPVYLWISDGRVEIREASRLWGKDTWQTLALVRQELGDTSLHAVSIGPAGENLVRGACIIQDEGRALGRCGIGAVMGSKNLKAMVVKGTGRIRIADRERFMKTANEVRKRIMNSKRAESMGKYGTLALLQKKQAVCGIAYKNFQECRIPDEMAEAILPTRTIDRYRVGRSSFPGCPIGCGQILHFTDGPYAGLTTTNNQWEVVSNVQSRLAIREPQFMFKVNAYCNQLGLDTDLAGGTIGWAMECYQRGIINEQDTDGIKLEWGDAAAVLKMIRKIAYREGFGDILAEGSARAAERIGRGSGYHALHLKKQDLYEPCRGCNGWSLGATTSTRGGGHTTGAPAIESTEGLDAEKGFSIYGVRNINRPQDYEGRAKLVVETETLHRLANCLGICHFNTVWTDLDFMNVPEMAELYSAATGWERSVGDLKRCTEKQLHLEKAFNLRHTSFDRKDDMPTPRDLSEPIPTGNLAGWKIDEAQYNRMLDEYYELHGWNRESSFPTRKALVDLGLQDVANDLQKIGKLG